MKLGKLRRIVRKALKTLRRIEAGPEPCAICGKRTHVAFYHLRRTA